MRRPSEKFQTAFIVDNKKAFQSMKAFLETVASPTGIEPVFYA
jgi:hypothetical protein